MDIDKWLSINQIKITDEDTDESDHVILVDDLKELLKDHVLVPKEPVAVVEVWNQGGSGEFVTATGINKLKHGTKLYTAQENS